MRINSHLGVKRAGEILRRINVFRGVVALHVGRADDLSRRHAGPGDKHRHRVRPVVAPDPVVDLGRAPELAKQQHQRAVELAAVVKVVDQRRHAGVDPLDFFPERLLENVAVMIPAAVVNRDERHADPGQAASQQQALAEVVPAVAIANLSRFPLHIERSLGLGR